MILPQSEIRDLTGYVRVSAQIRWLHKHGWRFTVNGLGAPVVARAEYERHQAGYQAPGELLTIDQLRALSRETPFRCGGVVYFLWDADDADALVYIGQSCSPRSRLQTHRDQARIAFTHATFIISPQRESREDLEMAYIRVYRPLFNVKIL